MLEQHVGIRQYR